MVIAYDQPIVDMIAALNATGHVTHRSWPKTSVTLHHNARVGASHQDILDGWKARPSSAHFDVDNAGAPAQYVAETEYAWAVGNTAGNQSSISIEMANSGGGPDWPVSEVTWRSAARLAGWLFAHVIHARPTTTSLLPHRHWSATACPGPYVLSVFGQILTAAQAAYDEFTAPPRVSHTQTAPLPAQEDDDMPAILTTPEGAFLLLSGRFYEHLTPSDLESVAPASSSGSPKPISADLHAKLKAWAAK